MKDRKKVLGDIFTVFDSHQAYSNQKVIEPAAFKDLQYPTTDIVKMLGNLIQNKIIICNTEKQMYLNKSVWNQYLKRTKRKVIAVTIVCVIISLVVLMLTI